ncbi:tyrosine-protein phosphatase 10D [Leptinotarsa decemlineata]|uniref:tyrosine-protein phosphatase 10D n=1 Tax=Leptinotarsa decemlineata TaxID=7539 RepID=UPI003D308CB7
MGTHWVFCVLFVFIKFSSGSELGIHTEAGTTEPDAPGEVIVWFRNETNLVILWKPPHPTTIFTQYKVSIAPPDAKNSILYVEKSDEPLGPGVAAFKDLVPGRVYNISIETVSGDKISRPTTVQFRTVPSKPQNISFDAISTQSFVVHWEAPSGESDFDKYQISLGNELPPVTVSKEDPTFWEFKDNLEPGKTYSVVIKTVSGRVVSLPVTSDVTLKSLPV